jgi:hypothetical protein
MENSNLISHYASQQVASTGVDETLVAGACSSTSSCCGAVLEAI